MEDEVSRILHERFALRIVEIHEEKSLRMGADGLLQAIVGTLACCGDCQPSKSWLGLHSPEQRIRESGLWAVQNLKSHSLSGLQMDHLSTAISASL